MKQSSTYFFQFALLLVILAASTLIVPFCEAAGGMAEMKGLTGDAPYMGTGNQEQAPEYFGEALQRQYYQNPAYGYDGGYYGGSRYSRNYYRSMPYQQQQPYYNNGPGGGLFYQAYAPLYRPAAIAPAPFSAPAPLLGGSSPLSSAFGGGFYSGRGNDWSAH